MIASRKTATTLSLFMALLLCACATLPQRIRKDIDKGNLQSAIADSKEYLDEQEPKHPEHRPKILGLLEEARFRLARRRDTVESYSKFLKTYPQSDFRKDAIDNLARVTYENYTRRADTLEAYDEFLTRFPEGEYAELAKTRSATLAWRAANQEHTILAYREFRERYEKHPLAQRALEKEMSLAWAEVEKDLQPEALLAFAAMYPFTVQAETAQVLAHGLAWKQARAKDSFQRYSWFRKLFPKSPHLPQAYAREVTLAWHHAESRDREKIYHWFRTTYPDTKQAPLAEVRERDWAYFNSSRSTEKLRTSVQQVNDQDPEKVWVHVDVRDTQGRRIAGLAQEDFTVYENGRSTVPLEFIGMESSRPLDIVFLIDLSGSMEEEIYGVKVAAMLFASTLKFRNRDTALGLVGFLEKVDRLFGNRQLTRDAKQFQNWVASLKLLSGTKENPIQALHRATRYRFRKGAQRVFVLITDEHPNIARDPRSKMGPLEIGRFMAKNNVTFYAITPNHPAYQTMVRETDGALFDIEKLTTPHAFRAQVQEIADRLSKQYRIAYKSPRGIQRGGHRAIRIRAREPKVWITLGTPIKGTLLRVFTDPSKPCNILAATREGDLYQTSDCGDSWSAIRHEALQVGIQAVEGRLGDDGALLLLTNDGGLLRFNVAAGVDGFEVLSVPGSIRLFSWDHGEKGALWVLIGNQLWVSTNLGASFEMAGPPQGDAKILSLVADPHRPGRVCLVTDAGQIRCGSHSGEWVALGSIDMLTGAWPEGTLLLFHPWRKDLVFLFSPGQGVFRSMDGGMVWSRGLVPAEDQIGAWKRFGPPMFVNLGEHAALLCYGSPSGVYCSSDDGLHWSKVSSGLPGGDIKTGAYILGYTAGGGMILGHPGTGNLYRLFRVTDREFVSGKVFFQKNSHMIRDKSLLTFLERFAKELAAHQEKRVRIEGHTDSDGNPAYNQKLSQQRAETVRAHMLDHGARSHQIEAYGYGESRPVFPNTSVANKSQNRRVEILRIQDFDLRSGQW